MRTLTWLMFVGLTLTQAQAATVMYVAMMDGKSEAPAVETDGRGRGQLIFDPATKEGRWLVSWQGLSGPATAAHVHCGAEAGANAGVALNLGDASSGKVSGTGQFTDAQFAGLEAGKCYINVHTEKNKGGEVRGQISKTNF